MGRIPYAVLTCTKLHYRKGRTRNSADEKKGKMYFKHDPDNRRKHSKPVFYSSHARDAFRANWHIDLTAIKTMRQRSTCGTPANAFVPVF